MDAVLIGKLPVAITVVQVHGVVFQVARRIWFLDATTAGRVIMGYRETYHAAIREGDGTLHQALAKGTTTHDGSPVLVLQRTRHNLGSRGGELVDKHHHTAFLHLAAPRGLLLVTGRYPALRVDDQVAPLQELVGYLYGGHQITTAIVLEVEIKSFMPFWLRLSSAADTSSWLVKPKLPKRI